MKSQKIEFKHYKETGISVCKIKDKDLTFVGKAKCHPDDEDMKSEKVGCEIAYSRAVIEALKHKRDCVIKPSLRALRQLYFSMKNSKKFNPKAYETKMMWRQIQNWQFDLTTINEMLATERKNLHKYITEKEKFYESIRKNRNKAKNN